MASAGSRVAVIGSGISGAACASILASKGVSVTVFESGRGAGGRMAQRRVHFILKRLREVTEDGKELFFDHGAPYFTVTNAEVMDTVKSWEARGLVAEWNEKFGVFDWTLASFVEVEKDGPTKKYVGFPGMNSICKALCRESGVEAKFGVTVGNLEWVADRSTWNLTSLDGQYLGNFDGIVASDKNVFSQRFTGLTGRPPPLDVTIFQEKALDLQHVSFRSCFVLMLAFLEPLQSINLHRQRQLHHQLIHRPCLQAQQLHHKSNRRLKDVAKKRERNGSSRPFQSSSSTSSPPAGEPPATRRRHRATRWQGRRAGRLPASNSSRVRAYL